MHRWRLISIGVIAACGAAVARAPSVPVFAIDVHGISNGAATLGNACSRLDGTLGQPVPGFSAGGAFALSAGIQPILAAGAGDVLFFDGFEVCAP